MLEIFVNNHKVTVAPDTSITLVMSNPIFESGGIPTPYSLTYKLPNTPRNLDILGNPERVASLSNFAAKLPSSIYFGGIEIASGVQTIESIENDAINVSFNVYPLPETSRLHLQNITLPTLKLKEATLKTIYSFFTYWSTDGSAEEYAWQMEAEMAKPYPNYAAPTMAIKDAELIPIDDASEQNPSYINERVMSVNSCYNGANKSKILQSINAGYIIKQVFPDISGVLYDDDFARLMVLGTYHPKYQIETDSQVWEIDKTTKFVEVKLQDFLPDIPFDDFLCNILKLPCASMYIVDGKPVLEYNKDIINRGAVIHWDDKIIGTPTINFISGDRYSAGYSDMATDEPVPIEELVYDDITIEQMVNPTVIAQGDAIFDGRYLRVAQTGQVFQARTNPVLSTDTLTHYNYKLIVDTVEPGQKSADKNDDRSQFDMLFNGAPVRMVVAVDVEQDAKMRPSFTGAMTNHQYVFCPEMEYNAQEKTHPRPDKLIVGLWHGTRPSMASDRSKVFGYPCLSRYHTTPYGSIACNTSLMWDGPFGLLEKYHKEYKKWIESDKRTIKANVVLSNVDLHNLDLRNKFHIEGRNFFIKELSITIKDTSIEPAEVEFVEI